MDEASIFLEALQKPAPADRAAYLDRACAGNAELRRNVEMLLAAQAKAGDFLNKTPANVGPTIDQSPADRPGTVIGPYKLLQQIGEGGMGVVWMAEQTQPVQRKVALKVIKPGMDSRQVIARFEAERQALAMMDHVNIARVLDAGTTESGLPYFVMELVHGVPITQYCDDIHLTPRERLELFIPVCQAIQHAHQKGIIHRDIKPSNVMVTLYDGKPVPKVIDFGVAKATEQTLTERTLFTQYGTMVGTLEYMSPEQAEMSALGADTRSDIFSLGVLLYELLTGSTPLSRKRVREVAYAEILRLIKEEEPPKPSTRLSDSGEALASISAQRKTEPAKLSKLMRGELDWIVMKTLEKDRNRRYETANGLAADVQRYLADEPVQACPPSALYRFGKFARRNKRALATAALLSVMLLVAIGAVAGSFGWVMRDKAARLAQAAGEIDAALREARVLQQQQKWAEALAVVKNAQMLLTSSGDDEDLRLRLVERIADLEMVVKLETARMRAADAEADHLDFEQSEAAYAKAFREYGVDVEAMALEVAGPLLRARSIRVELAAALDDWAWILHEQKEKFWQDRLALARATDPDPFRDRVRGAVARGDRAALTELAVAEQVTDLPAATLVLMAHVLEAPGEATQSLALLRKTQRRHPGDFWINLSLAVYLSKMTPSPADQVIRYGSMALAIRPHNWVICNNLGNAFSKKGELDAAIVEYREAIRLSKDQALTDSELGAALKSNLGAALQAKHRYDEAIVECRGAIRLKPDLAEAHTNLGNALSGKGQLDGAIAEFREAIRLKNDDAEAHCCLGGVLRDKGQLAEAIAECREAIRLKPDLAEAHGNLGTALHDKGQLDEAIAEDREAIRLKPYMAGAHVNLGNALKDKGQLDEAIAEDREAIRLEPDLAEAHGSLGNALTNKGQLDEAVAEDREAIRLEPDLAESHGNLGSALTKKGQLDEAIAECREAIRLKKDSAGAHEILGAALREKGELSESIAELRDAIRLKKDFPEAHGNLGLALTTKGQLDEAVVVLNEAVRLAPNSAETNNALAWLLATCANAKLRDPGRAVELAKRAIALAPSNVIIWNTLGVARYRAGDWNESAVALEKSVEIRKGGDAFDWFFLAMANWRLNHQEEARKWYDQAVAWTEKNKPQDEELLRFRAEAEELLKVKK